MVGDAYASGNTGLDKIRMHVLTWLWLRHKSGKKAAVTSVAAVFFFVR